MTRRSAATAAATGPVLGTCARGAVENDAACKCCKSTFCWLLTPECVLRVGRSILMLVSRGREVNLLVDHEVDVEVGRSGSAVDLKVEVGGRRGRGRGSTLRSGPPGKERSRSQGRS
jgi:hypothetical protein